MPTPFQPPFALQYSGPLNPWLPTPPAPPPTPAQNAWRERFGFLSTISHNENLAPKAAWKAFAFGSGWQWDSPLMSWLIRRGIIQLDIRDFGFGGAIRFLKGWPEDMQLTILRTAGPYTAPVGTTPPGLSALFFPWSGPHFVTGAALVKRPGAAAPQATGPIVTPITP